MILGKFGCLQVHESSWQRFNIGTPQKQEMYMLNLSTEWINLHKFEKLNKNKKLVVKKVQLKKIKINKFYTNLMFSNKAF